MVVRRSARSVWLSCLALVIALEAAGICASTPDDSNRDNSSPDSSNDVHLKFAADGVITVQVSIDGNGPFRLLLDTGSNRSAITATVADRLHLQPVAHVAIVSATAAGGCDIVRIESMTLGRVTKRQLAVSVIDGSGRTALGPGVDGILGQDFLLDEAYTIDYDRGRLSWNVDRSTQPGVIALPLKKDEGRWLVALPQSPDAAGPLWFVPDSGASMLTMFDRGTPNPIAFRPLPALQTMTTIGGSRNVQLVLVDRLRIGTLVVSNQPAVVIDRREPDAPAGDGLLPLSLFKSVSFDPLTSTLVVRAR